MVLTTHVLCPQDMYYSRTPAFRSWRLYERDDYFAFGGYWLV